MTTLTMPQQQTFAPSRRREEFAMSDFVEQKIFTSEIKRIDSEVSNIKKTEDKQDKTVFEAINRLHSDMDKRFERIEGEMNGKFERVEGEMNRKFEHLDDKIDSNFRWLVGMYLTGLGVTLAAFYAFASYIKG